MKCPSCREEIDTLTIAMVRTVDLVGRANYLRFPGDLKMELNDGYQCPECFHPIPIKMVSTFDRLQVDPDSFVKISNQEPA